MEIQQGLYNPEISNVAKETGGNLSDINTRLQYINEFSIPKYDTQVIDETDPDNITITYKYLGVTVATKTISVSGSITTISVTL